MSSSDSSTALTIRRKGGGAFGVPDGDGRYVLQAEGAWIVEGPAAAIQAAQAALADVSVPVTATALEVNFGNAVGLFRVPGLGRLDVVSGKWQHRHFEAMLADLMDEAGNLPFAAGAAAALPYDRSVAAREDVLYHAFVYLRRIVSDDDVASSDDRLLVALDHVLREPHRRFVRHREHVPLELAHRIDPGGLARLAAGQEELVSVRGTRAARLPLTGALRGHLPLRVEQVRVEATCDTPENRFVKAFLDQALGIVARVRQRTQQQGGVPAGAFARRIRDDCERIERRLRPVRRHALWDEVGAMVHLPAGSTVLQRRRGYREVYRHFARLRLAARVPLAAEVVWDLLEARDIAELYELWCYFSLVRLLRDLLGDPVEAGGPAWEDWGLAVRWDLAVCWADGTRLVYNPRFSRSQPSERRSYSVPLRPDVALEVPHGPNAGLHLFDAKFKLDRLDALLGDERGPGGQAEANEERRGTFKRGDLYKMHAYRDAIQRAHSVWILYPGSEARFFGLDGQAATSTCQPLELPASVDGVGGVPLVPLAGPAAQHLVGSLLRHLLQAGLPLYSSSPQ